MARGSNNDTVRLVLSILAIAFLGALFWALPKRPAVSDYASWVQPLVAAKRQGHKADKRPPLWLWVDIRDEHNPQVALEHLPPFLTVCVSTIMRHNSEDFAIHLLSRANLSRWLPQEDWPDVLRRQGALDAVNPSLADTVLGEVEMRVIQHCILARHGGLWMSAASLCFEPLAPYVAKMVEGGARAAVFDCPDQIAYCACVQGQPVAGDLVMWAAGPDLQCMKEWAADWKAIAAFPLKTGQSFRDTQSMLREKYLDRYEGIMVHEYWSSATRMDGKPIRAEDLLSKTAGPAMPPVDCPLLPLPLYDLVTRTHFAWFVKLSEAEFVEGDMVVSELARRALAAGSVSDDAPATFANASVSMTHA
jgi:hypothetical protein